jgi:hypothetical protein
MKELFSLAIILIFISCQKDRENFVKKTTIPSKIDCLLKTSEIEDYFYHYDSIQNYDSVVWRHSFRKFHLKKIQDFEFDSEFSKTAKTIADSIGKLNDFDKADFDNNGYTDLLVTGFFDGSDRPRNFVLMNFGKDSIFVSDVDPYYYSTAVLRIIDKSRLVSLEASYPFMYESYNSNKVITKKKNLIYRYGGFVEINPKPQKHNIEKIEFNSNGCMGTCPVFKITIEKNMILTYEPEYFNFSDDGNKKETQILKRKLSELDYNKIIGLIDYINFTALDAYFPESATDGQSAKIKVTYKDGKVKTVEDHLYPGTYGLKRLYEIIYELRKNTAGNTR